MISYRSMQQTEAFTASRRASLAAIAAPKSGKWLTVAPTTCMDFGHHTNATPAARGGPS